MNIVKPDWNIFKAKFNENPQKNFEWFCYLLFCKEFNKPFGIFRYKNQSAIETNPIILNKDIIGWQAKFYDTTLSDHKGDLTETIAKIKRDYPNLTKVIIYTNQEWGQGKSQNDPQAKIEIEQKAKDCLIEIEWRTGSYFESSFVSIDNNNIAKHFFSLDNSIIDLLKRKEVHSESILYGIQTRIDFDSEKIQIDRSKALESIQKELNYNQILIINGVGGVGKTAVVKNLYNGIKANTPFYIFKASEFNINNINELFDGFGLTDFLDVHKDETNKIIVIDSAEKLLDLHNTDPFKEFLAALIQYGWKIIFTTRNNYLEDLNYQFIEIYKITPQYYDIQNLTLDELRNMSQKYVFILPEDIKLLELIKNPFYLSEYLKFYKKDENVDYLNFKENLWNKTIKKSKPTREQCFLQIAFQRANQSQFFMTIDSGDILDDFVQEGILGYETPGYFITHDIYEEWALEKIIQSEFIKKKTNKELFEKIGESLPMRRSFRNWVSEKLLLKYEPIKQFIEDVIYSEDIESFWKDEVLVSVLLSDYSDGFFELFSEKLLENSNNLMKKISLLLRIACKEIDNDFYRQMGLEDLNSLSIEFFLTKPKGEGWKSFIRFVYENIDVIGVQNIYFILPIIHDWNSKYKEGQTTKISSLLALRYYQWTIQENIYFSRDEKVKDKLFQTILYGASQIKEELATIFDEILQNKWKRHNDTYNDLVETILQKFGDNIEVIKALPSYTLKLAELYWFRTTEDENYFYDSGRGVEKYFGLEDDHLEYYPASSYQTPIYWLLQSSFKETIDFILCFMNKAVECFAKSEFAKNEIGEINVCIGDGRYIKQYICNRLWNTYRGTQVSPHVLESMHMALEKFFLERAKNFEENALNGWLLYLLNNSKSASITAIVVSIVLANPDKAYNTAIVLFQTREFFIYDKSRMLLDKSAISNFSIGYGLNYKNKLHQDERIKSCDEKHRRICLEDLAFNYQFFRSEEISEEEVERRQHNIWQILDKYYDRLMNKYKDTQEDKTWRLFLARMDRRKMKPMTEEKDGQIFISFNPEIDPDLKEFSETSIEEVSERMKYTALSLWSKFKMRNDDQYKDYEQYENNPALVLKEVKEIIDELKVSKDMDYHLLNNSIPGHACSVLIRDYFDKLSRQDKLFCKDVILSVASSSLREDYQYQIFDGVEAAIYVLPILLKEFPEDKITIKTILLLTLFDDTNIGAYCEFSDYSKKAILNYLWETNYEDAQSLLLGYLILKPEYEQVWENLQKKNYKKNIYQIRKDQVISEFLKKNEKDLKKVVDCKITLGHLCNLELLDLSVLKTTFQLIPNKTENAEHKKLVCMIIDRFAKELLSDKREDKVDYKDKHDFLQKLSYLVLYSKEQDISNYLSPFYKGFNSSEAIADLFNEFISAEDRLNAYNNFWFIWNTFYEKIVELCKEGEKYWYVDKILKTYLFAQSYWKDDITEWHTLKDNNKTFFRKISESSGHCQSVLFSISKLINGIGSIYLNDGVFWISNMITSNCNVWPNLLDDDTSFYMERAVKKYIYLNREKIRITKQLKEELLVILDFLIEKGSVVGYLLRENIL